MARNAAGKCRDRRLPLDMIRIPKNRKATHPGEMLLHEFLIPMGLTQKQLADSIHVPFQRINELISGKRGVTPSTALRLAKFFGMSPDFWLNMQMRCDIQNAQLKEGSIIRSIKKIKPAKIAA